MVQVIAGGESCTLQPQVLPFADPAIQFGAGGFFETLRVDEAKLHLFGRHWERLSRTLRAWNLAEPCSAATLLDAIRVEIDSVGEPFQRVRITVGPDPSALDDPSDLTASRAFIEARPLALAYRPALGDRPEYRVTVLQDYALATNSPLSGYKSGQYYLYWEARRRAMARKFDEAILLNERGELAEASAFNLFWVREGALLTPCAECGCLPGVFAAYLRETAKALGIAVREVRAPAEDLLNAEAAFLTNSLAEVIGISGVDERKFASAKKHPLLQPLFDRIEAGGDERMDVDLRAAT